MCYGFATAADCCYLSLNDDALKNRCSVRSSATGAAELHTGIPFAILLLPSYLHTLSFHSSTNSYHLPFQISTRFPRVTESTTGTIAQRNQRQLYKKNEDNRICIAYRVQFTFFLFIFGDIIIINLCNNFFFKSLWVYSDSDLIQNDASLKQIASDGRLFKNVQYKNTSLSLTRLSA